VDDDAAMGLALEEAATAAAHGDVPVGAVVVGPDGTVLARRHNERELAGDPTAHAEVLALRAAAAALGTWRLSGCTLVVTLEPCPMCAGAAVASRLARVVFGPPDPKAGATGSLYNLCADRHIAGLAGPAGLLESQGHGGGVIDRDRAGHGSHAIDPPGTGGERRSTANWSAEICSGGAGAVRPELGDAWRQRSCRSGVGRAQRASASRWRSSPVCSCSRPTTDLPWSEPP